jgi:flagellar biosynthesis protein FlhF
LTALDDGSALTWHAAEATAAASDSPPGATRRSEPARAMLWTDSGVAAQMQGELKALRAMIEHQMPGLAWRDFRSERPLQAALLRDLSRLGLPAQCARTIATQVDGQTDFDVAWRRCLAVLAHALKIVPSPFADGGRIAVLGQAGVGKSTVIAKAAAQYALRHGADQVAIVTLDNIRVGAEQQLRSFGRLLGVTVRAVPDPEALAECLDSLEQYRLVLIDTPGFGTADPRVEGLHAALALPRLGIRTVRVLATTTEYHTLARSVAGAAADAWVLTKLDEAALLGPALAILVEHGLPVACVSAGQRIPHDLEPAMAHRLVARAVALARPGNGAENENLELEQAFAC